MMQLTTEQRVFVVTQFTLIPNVTALQNAFRIRFPDRNPPVRNTILKNVRKYIRTQEQALTVISPIQEGEELLETKRTLPL